MSATGGGTLAVTAIAIYGLSANSPGTVDNTGGLVEAQSGGTVLVENRGAIRFGTIQADAGGTVQVDYSGVLRDVTLTGPGSFVGTANYRISSELQDVTIAAGTTYTVMPQPLQGPAATLLGGTIVNHGTLGAAVNNYTGYLGVDGPVTLTGGGSVVLNGGGLADTVSLAPETGFTVPLHLTDGPDRLTNVDNTIRGYGSVSATLTNQSGGVIEADVAGQTLSVGNVTNHGLMSATGGGTLAVTAIAIYGLSANSPGTVDNTGGLVEAQSGGTVLVENRGAIRFGTIQADAGGIVRIDQEGMITDINITGTGIVDISPGGLAVDPTIMSGTLELETGSNITGSIAFSTTSGGQLRLDGSTIPTNIISGFLPSDLIDLRGIQFDPSGRVDLLASNILRISENGHTYDFQLNPSEDFTRAAFHFGSDGTIQNGTDLTVSFNSFAVTELLAHDTGVSSNDRITSDPTVTGSGDPNALVTIREGSTAIGTVAADATGIWSFTPLGLIDGTHTLLASETDSAGNTATASLSFTLDASSPTGSHFAYDYAHLVAIEGSINSKGLTADKPIGAFSQIGAHQGDLFTFSLSGRNAASFIIDPVSGSLSTASSTIGGAKFGSVYQLSIAITDTTNGQSLTPLPLDVIVADHANDTINLSAGANNLGVPSSTMVLIYGLGGDDFINAAGSSNELWFIGGSGGDTLIGGNGINHYLYGATSESMPGNGKFDTITHFNVNFDSIDLFGLETPLNYVGQEPTGTRIPPHSIAWQYNAGNTFVYVDSTSSSEVIGKADMQIVLNGIIPLTDTNFHHF